MKKISDTLSDVSKLEMRFFNLNWVIGCLRSRITRASRKLGTKSLERQTGILLID